MTSGSSFSATATALQFLGGNLLEREMGNIRPIFRVLNRHRADIAIFIEIELRVFIQVSRLRNLGNPELEVERVGILKILNRHEVNLLSKEALCTVSRFGNRTTRRNRFSISSIGAQRRI